MSADPAYGSSTTQSSNEPGETAQATTTPDLLDSEQSETSNQHHQEDTADQNGRNDAGDNLPGAFSDGKQNNDEDVGAQNVNIDVEGGNRRKNKDRYRDNEDDDDDANYDNDERWDEDYDDGRDRDYWGRERQNCCRQCCMECLRGFCIPPGCEVRRIWYV